MWRTLARFVDTPTVVALLFLSALLFVVAATAGPVGSVLAGGVGILAALGALVMVFLIYLKRVNAEIDDERHDLRRDLDEMLEESNEEE